MRNIEPHHPVVLHLDMPRGLSLTVKPWRQDLYRALRSCQIDYRQIDLNPDFWRHFLEDQVTGHFQQLLNIRYQAPAVKSQVLARASGHLQKYRGDKVRLDLEGFSLDGGITDSSEQLLEWVTSDASKQWLFPCIESLSAAFSEAGIVSLGAGSPDELAIAATIAEFLRLRHPAVHSILTLHRWENFSLAPGLESLCREGKLLELFDSVALREDKAGECLSGLHAALYTQDLGQLQYIGTTIDDQPAIVGDISVVSNQTYTTLEPDEHETGAISDYLASLGIPCDSILMMESFVRNDCHYGRCTFCVQNIGYPAHQQYKHSPELERALTLIGHLANVHGVRSFTFLDQALPRALVTRICQQLASRKLPIRWCCRMLPEQADMPRELLCQMAALGCREILVGPESTNPETLEFMGKSPDFHEPRAHQWLQRCAEAGIDVTLSAIQHFPTESRGMFESSTGRFLHEAGERYSHINTIVNSFALFAKSPMAREPEAFNIAAVDAPAGDLTWVLNFRDNFGRCSADRPASEEVYLHDGAVTEAQLKYFHYSSFGLLYRWDTGRWLPDDLGSAREGVEAPQFEGRGHVIVGSEGYLGYNLARMLPAAELVLSSRRKRSNLRIDAPYISEDLIHGNSKLMQLAPTVAWICARPVCNEFSTHARFNYFLETLLEAWAQKGSLRRLVFFSTQLVAATPEPGERVTGKSPFAPHSPYDLGKAKLEVLCDYLARQYNIDVDVVRLPLLWGGEALPEHREIQYIHQWREQLGRGDYWEIDPGHQHYGNSWVDISDLLNTLVNEGGNGLRVRSVKSGDFTYAQMMDNWRQTPSAEKVSQLHLVKSRFLMEDEVGVEARDLFQETPNPT